MTRLSRFFVLASAAVLGMATVAHADPIGSIDTFYNTPNNAINLCCFEVTLTQESMTDIKVQVSLIDGATFFAGTGSGNHPGFAFNLAGDPGSISMSLSTADDSNTNWTFGNGTSSNSPHANNDPVTSTSPDMGAFDYQFNLNSNGTSGKVDSLTFNITDLAGIQFSDFTKNADGVYFVADILDKHGNTGLSGICSPGKVTITPEPSSLFLLGTGIFGAGFLVRRRAKASQA